MNPTSTFLDAARQGKASPWRYLVGFCLILFTWLFLGSLATIYLFILLARLQGVPLAQLSQLASDPSALGMIPEYLILNLSFLFFFAGVWLAVRGIHQRPFRSVVTAAPAIDWRRIALGFGLWLGLGAFASLVEYLIWPSTFSLNFQPKTFLPFALLALIFTPVQTTSEELFFRGYLVQAGSLFSRNPIYLTLLSGILFMLPHIANPEVAANFTLVMLSYFILGAFLAWISLKDGTLELAIGVHAANNLFAALVVTFPSSALQTPAIFFTTHFDPLFNLVMVLVICLLFYLLVFRRKPQRAVAIP